LILASFIETLAFVIGSAYFVAGSYPETVEGSQHGSQHRYKETDIELNIPTKNDLIPETDE
jgi:hypothetical protein